MQPTIALRSPFDCFAPDGASHRDGGHVHDGVDRRALLQNVYLFSHSKHDGADDFGVAASSL
jgi:hypothetical protein